MKKMNTIYSITYRFVDSSKPPMYHRSYTIVVKKEEAMVTVDCYGAILATKKYTVSENEFQHLISMLKDCKLSDKPLKGDCRGCTGGTSEIISYSSENAVLFSGSVYHCGGSDTGNLSGDISGFAREIRRLIPDLRELTKDG